MTDDLEQRLHRLSDLRMPPAPSIAALRERGRQQAARKSRRAAAAVVALGAAAGVFGFATRDPKPADVTVAAPTETSPAPPTETSVPSTNNTGSQGEQRIAGPDGELVGTISADAWDQAMDDGPPMRGFGTQGREFQTLEVKDAEGVLVGYFTLGGPGFVPLATANDPAAMDALLEDSPEPMTQAEAKAAFEDGYETTTIGPGE